MVEKIHFANRLGKRLQDFTPEKKRRKKRMLWVANLLVDGLAHRLPGHRVQLVVGRFVALGLGAGSPLSATPPHPHLARPASAPLWGGNP